MKKIYLIIAGAFLILLVVISIFLSLGKKTATTTQTNTPFPTDVPLPESARQFGQEQTPTGAKNLIQETVNSDDISTIPPVETKDFKLQYSPRLDKLVVEKKTANAEAEFEIWADQNELPMIVGDPNLVLMVDLGRNPDEVNILIEFLSLFVNLGRGVGSPINSQTTPTTSTVQISNSSLSSSNGSPGNINFTYFPQCGDLGNISLPDGCDLCSAGCGATTVSMIASSYLGGGYDPRSIVNMYESKNYLLGCDGSRYSDAHELLKSFGLKTTDYIVFDSEKSDTVVPQLRKYLNAGWTFFTLASFCEKGCGHYFWITDIDDQGNIFAYDPAYGRYQIPYNENSRYPYPLYRLAFGVKR